MSSKEATARIKINKLLEAAGWRFFAEGKSPANIQLEPSVTIKTQDLEALGKNFEKSSKGFIDFLLLNEKGFPFIVLEAKAESKNPLVGKEQARKYAQSQKCRFVILSNGNLHYFWDLERGNPYVITTFPTPSSVMGYQKSVPDPKRLVEERIGEDYVVLTQRPGYADEAAWKHEAERDAFITANSLRFLRPYQKKAMTALQNAVKNGKDRFLFEMATGTGKTLTAAAVIKLFLRTGNAQRVLFLVDRLELEDQAWKAFTKVLANDYKTVIYKDNRDDWRHAEIVVTTVQSLLFNNKYQHLFSPTDFDLVISDEAHRSIGGNARAVFDYFIGYKLGLTATPRDYLKKFNKSKNSKDPRELERRILLDTYRTFGCEDGHPTYRYSLLDGVKDGFLINPTVVDTRSEVTTQLLSEQGFVVDFKDDQGEDQKETFKQSEFEKRFFSDATNIAKVFFVNYTQHQCNLHGIEVESGICLEHVFDWEELSWDDIHVDLPVNPKSGQPILLVPKDVVRRFPIFDYQDFWNTTYRYILRNNVLSSSVKSIGKQPKVYWKDINRKFKYSKRTVVKVLHAQPELRHEYVDKFESRVKKVVVPDDLFKIQGAANSRAPVDNLINELQQIEPGNAHAKAYERLILRILTRLFSPPLSSPEVQVSSHDGREIIDITFYNSADDGFWSDVKSMWRGQIVIFELKNMTDLSNEEFFQLNARLDDIRGTFGVLISRAKDKLDIQRAYRRLANERKVMLVLTDEDMINMLKIDANGDDPTEEMQRIYREFIDGH